jgi:steroid delta-isomerase-like uncharacterized protein
MDNLEIGRRHLEAYNNDKWDEYKADLVENVKYEEVATRTTATGKDQYVEAVRRWKKGFPDTKAKILTQFSAGDTVISEIEWTGTHTGVFEGPFGAIQPTNKVGSVRAVLVSKFANGKIVEVRHYFDIMTILAQTGVLAGLSAAVQRKAGEARPSAS